MYTWCRGERQHSDHLWVFILFSQQLLLHMLRDAMRTARVARSIAEDVWKAVGWICDRRLDAVLRSLDYVYA